MKDPHHYLPLLQICIINLIIIILFNIQQIIKIIVLCVFVHLIIIINFIECF